MGFVIVGAAVTLAVNVVANTFDKRQLTAIAVAENVITPGGVAAPPPL